MELGAAVSCAKIKLDITIQRSRATMTNKSIDCLTVAVDLEEGESVGCAVAGFDDGERVDEAEGSGALVPLKVTKPIQKRSVESPASNLKRICEMGP